jgi:hypothetical protein
MSQKNENTALVEQQTGGFAALANTNFAQLVSSEMDGLDMSFERVKIPNGGSTYEFPSEGDDKENVKEWSGVFLHHHPLNAFYKSAYKGGNTPPDCGSFDGKVGEGDPGGLCAKCPNNVYGTGANGASKACKNKHRIYLLREGDVFPMLLTLPTGSLKTLSAYLKRLLSKGRMSNSVVTRFSLKKATGTSGEYTQAVFSLDRVLTPDEYAHIAKLSEQVKALTGNIGFDDDGQSDDEPFVDPETGEIIEPLGR